MTALVGIGVPAVATAWEALGFRVDGDAVALPNGALLLGRDGFVVDGEPGAGDLESIPVASGDVVPPTSHACGAVGLDHVVVVTDSLERTSAAVEAAFGLPCRRVREAGAVRQAFHRFADAGGVRGCIVEVVESGRVDVPSVMGVVVNVDDLHALADRLGPDVMSRPKPAVQPGRFIATVRREVGLGTAVALMTPG